MPVIAVAKFLDSRLLENGWRVCLEIEQVCLGLVSRAVVIEDRVVVNHSVIFVACHRFAPRLADCFNSGPLTQSIVPLLYSYSQSRNQSSLFRVLHCNASTAEVLKACLPQACLPLNNSELHLVSSRCFASRCWLCLYFMLRLSVRQVFNQKELETNFTLSFLFLLQIARVW